MAARLLKFKEDRRTLAFEGLTLLSMGFVMGLPYQPLLSTFVVPLSFLCFCCCVINHNNKHHGIFHSAALDFLNNMVLSLCIGAPGTRLHLVHHFNHHKDFQNQNDWSRYTLAGQSSGPWRLLKYWALSTREMFLNRWKLQVPVRQKRELQTERVLLWAFIAFGLVLNWHAMVFIIFPSWLVGLYGILTANLLNHDRCDLHDDWRHSRNFSSKVENYLLFNAGFHTAHHLRPATHWSKLHEVHLTEVAEHLEPLATEPSFFIYLTRHYLFGLGDQK